MLTAAKKFAVLVDIDNVPINAVDLKNILKQVEAFGEISYAKFYGFSDRKHKELEEIINNEAYDTAQRMRDKKRNKSQLDIRIVIDGIKIACTNNSIDAFCIIGGVGDFVPFISALKSLGKYVMGGFLNNEENGAACNHDLKILPNEVKIVKQHPVKIPKAVDTTKIERQSSADILSNINLDSIMNSAADEEKGVDVNDVLKQIEQIANDFNKINND